MSLIFEDLAAVSFCFQAQLNLKIYLSTSILLFCFWQEEEFVGWKNVLRFFSL